ncbi:uncharacterized protein LOC112462696, partial [Temnothorax curvispinosus]|uniref:Uncharacterized protein LOC112462696 n=1 Tax=Temnothorax curvispinosus TaxID=300111 RepID=A0A6J1QR18_9HYME
SGKKSGAVKDKSVKPATVVPLPKPTSVTDRPWTEVVKRGKRKEGGGAPTAAQSAAKGKAPPKRATEKAPSKGDTTSGEANVKAPATKPVPPKRKVPRTSAVVLTCPEGNYAECMLEVRRRIKLADLGIQSHNIRRTATNAYSIKVAGEGNKKKADTLAIKMAEVLAGKERVRVARLELMAELRLSNMDDSVSKADARKTLAEKGKIPPTAIKVGLPKRVANGLYTVVVCCPLTLANLLSRERKIVIGWAKAKVELLTKRPLQCYRCMSFGHTRATCTSVVDRTGLCYRCGKATSPKYAQTNHTASSVRARDDLPTIGLVGSPAKARKRPGKMSPI